MIDTHSHIYDPEFDADRDLVVRRAREAGVERILLPNINLDTIAPMLALCRQYSGYCHPMMGLHPEDVKEDYEAVLEQMHTLLLAPENPYIAVGEVGLDFYWDDSFRQQQLDAFDRQVAWAVELNLPLVIHTRKAHREVVDIMNAYRQKLPRGVFHCFSGTLDEARELLSFEGFVLGIGGVLTFKKSSLPEVVRALPLERMVLETDSPYLAPVPYRGRRNESSYLRQTLEKLAYEKNKLPEQVAKLTDSTVYGVFTKISSPEYGEKV